MSRFFPHTPFAEDQPLSHTILYTHVLTRGVTTGTIIASLITTARHFISSPRGGAAAAAAAAVAGTSSKTLLLPFTTRLLLSSCTGSLIGVGLSALATAGRMYGREDVEWRDRSWRLLANQGQVETDDWTYGGMLAGPAVLLATTATSGSTPLGWRGVVGASGLGSVAGMFGYLTWRYGVQGGKFPGQVKKEVKDL